MSETNTTKPTTTSPTPNNSNSSAAIAYVLSFVTGLIMYFSQPNDEYVRFHATQSIGLGIIWLATAMILSIIPVLGWLLLPFAQIGFVVITVICILKAVKGERYLLPTIGQPIQDTIKKLNL